MQKQEAAAHQARVPRVELVSMNGLPDPERQLRELRAMGFDPEVRLERGVTARLRADDSVQWEFVVGQGASVQA